MKTQKLILVLVFGFSIQSISAQIATLASGGDATGTGGKVCYSIGQVAYTTSNGSGGKVTQGVQQPFEIVTLGTDNSPEIILSMSVYPNPTKSLVSLTVGNLERADLQYYLTDSTGKQLQSRKIIDFETQIQIENYPNAVYFLNVFDNNKQLKTFKIIKN